jgi:hypothetical protein
MLYGVNEVLEIDLEGFFKETKVHVLIRLSVLEAMT